MLSEVIRTVDTSPLLASPALSSGAPAPSLLPAQLSASLSQHSALPPDGVQAHTQMPVKCPETLCRSDCCRGKVVSAASLPCDVFIFMLIFPADPIWAIMCILITESWELVHLFLLHFCVSSCLYLPCAGCSRCCCGLPLPTAKSTCHNHSKSVKAALCTSFLVLTPQTCSAFQKAQNGGITNS